MKDQKQQKETDEDIFSGAVSVSYDATLRAIHGRRNVFDFKPCFFCDNRLCTQTKTARDLCPLFNSLTAGWKTNRCFRCFSVGHGTTDCAGCGSDRYRSWICQNCLSPGCSRDTSAASDAVFTQYKLACACVSQTDFTLAERAKCVVFYVCHHQPTHAAFTAFVQLKFGSALSVPPFAVDGRAFFIWVMTKTFNGGPRRHVLNYIVLLDFWLSDAMSAARK